MWLTLIVTIGVRLFCNSALTGSYLLWGPLTSGGFRQSVLFERLTLLFADAGREKSNSWNGLTFPRLDKQLAQLNDQWMDINESVSGGADRRCPADKESAEKTVFHRKPDLRMPLHDQQHFPEHAMDPVFNRNDPIRRGHFNLGLRVNNTRLQFRFNFAMSASDDWSLSSVDIELGKLKPIVLPAQVQPYRWSQGFDNRTVSDRRWAMKAALEMSKPTNAFLLPRFSV